MVKFVTGYSNPATPTKHSIFRFLIPSEAILEDPETRDFVKDEGSMKIYLGEDKRIIWYPCRRCVTQDAFLPLPLQDIIWLNETLT